MEKVLAFQLALMYPNLPMPDLLHQDKVAEGPPSPGPSVASPGIGVSWGGGPGSTPCDLPPGMPLILCTSRFVLPQESPPRLVSALSSVPLGWRGCRIIHLDRERGIDVLFLVPWEKSQQGVVTSLQFLSSIRHLLACCEEVLI